MRQIGRLTTEREARAFGDLLHVAGIANDVEAERDGTWAVWVHDEDRLDEARGLLDAFAAGELEEDAHEVAREAEARRREEERKDRQARANFFRMSQRWSSEAFLSPTVGPLTAALMVASIGVALLSGLGKKDEPIRWAYITDHWVENTSFRQYRVWEKGLPEIRRGQVWRLVTPMFIHYGLLHILFNMLWLKDLGSLIERKQGMGVLLAVVLGTSAAANLAQYAMSGPAFGGMSGVVYALLGYTWMRARFDPMCGLFVDRRHVVWMGAWLFICMTGAVGPVANTAHVVGLAAGMAWGLVSSGHLRRLTGR